MGFVSGGRIYTSVIVTISRVEDVDNVVENLSRLEFGSHLVELIIGVDNSKVNSYELINRVKGLKPWRNLTVHLTRNKPPKKFDMAARRTRIAKLRNHTKEQLGGSDFVFSFEDDSVLKGDEYLKLWQRWRREQNPGFIEGVQVGRWGHKYIGGWTVIDIDKPSKYISLPFGKGLQPIDAGGFYCFLTTTKLYRESNFQWFDPMGPDANFVLQLRRKGYDCFIDFDILCGHKVKDKVLYPTAEDTVIVTQYQEDGKWKNIIKRKP